MYFENSNPSTAAGMKAMTRFLYSRKSILKKRARYSHTTASMAPVWMTILKTLQRSSFAPSKSPARMRWPVEEIGRNSVRPSTMPRTNASMRLAKELPDGLPECRHVVGAIVPRAAKLHPPLRTLPCVEQASRVGHRDDFVALGDEAEQRRGDRRRPA